MLSWDSHAEAGLGRVQPRNKLRWVACVGPHNRSMVAHVRGGQREERLACLVGRNGSNMSGAVVRLGRISFPSLVVGTTVRAAVTAVCAGSDVARVCKVRTVRVCLVNFRVFFGMTIIAAAARAVGTTVCRFSIQCLGVWRGLSTRGLVLFVRLRVSWWGAAARSGAG